MKMTRFKKSLSLVVCIVLIAAMALLATGCNGNKDTSSPSTTAPQVETTAPETTETQEETNVLGEGATKFTFAVTDAEGKQTVYQINTDKTTVGDALVELGIIAGEESEYGLYVKTVNGTTVDYDTDGKYWAFYINGEYASTGVDATDIEAGATYSFKVE